MSLVKGKVTDPSMSAGTDNGKSFSPDNKPVYHDHRVGRIDIFDSGGSIKNTVTIVTTVTGGGRGTICKKQHGGFEL